MGAIFTILFAKLAAIVKWFADLFVSIFVAVWDVLRDAMAWAFDQVLGVAVSAIGAIDISGVANAMPNLGALPAEMLNVMSLIGLDKAIIIITAAIGVRLALQLIPFVRLGS